MFGEFLSSTDQFAAKKKDGFVERSACSRTRRCLVGLHQSFNASRQRYGAAKQRTLEMVTCASVVAVCSESIRFFVVLLHTGSFGSFSRGAHLQRSGSGILYSYKLLDRRAND